MLFGFKAFFMAEVVLAFVGGPERFKQPLFGLPKNLDDALPADFTRA
jgi:hypothetical protein